MVTLFVYIYWAIIILHVGLVDLLPAIVFVAKLYFHGWVGVVGWFGGWLTGFRNNKANLSPA